MKNDTRIRVSHWYASAAVRGGVLVCFVAQFGLTPIVAFADVGLPPPAVHQTTNNSFPSAQALKRQGYDPSTGVLRVDERNRGTSTVTKSGNTITGQQQKTVTLTGNYGEKATTTTSVTQKVNTGKLESALGGTLAAATAAGGAIGSDYSANAYHDFKSGNYVSAAESALGAFVTGLSKLDITGLGSGINDFLDKSGLRKDSSGSSSLSQQADSLSNAAKQASAQQAKAEREGDLGGAIAQAAAKKASQGAAEAARQNDKNNKESASKAYSIMISYFKNGKWSEYSSLSAYTDMADERQNAMAEYDSKGKLVRITGVRGNSAENIANHNYLKFFIPQSSTPNSFINVKPFLITPQNKNTVTTPEVNLQNVTLNASEIQNILKRMLENQQSNHKELMNQLAKIGNTVEQATTSTETKPTVALSEPYTPSGSNTPQQTRFEIDKNGNVTTTTILRPDLKPNGSQAPTRTVVIPKKAETGSQTGQQENGENTNPTTGQTGEQQPTTGQTGEQQPTTGQTGQQQPTTGQTGQQQPATGQTGQQAPSTSQTAQNNQQNEQQKEFCEKNPNSAACAELGEADYEDLSIPENSIDLKLEPLDIFSTNGTCPSNPSFSLGSLGTFEIPYDYFCNIASLLRPILILGTIIMCGFFAYNAVKEL